MSKYEKIIHLVSICSWSIHPSIHLFVFCMYGWMYGFMYIYIYTYTQCVYIRARRFDTGLRNSSGFGLPPRHRSPRPNPRRPRDDPNEVWGGDPSRGSCCWAAWRSKLPCPFGKHMQTYKQPVLAMAISHFLCNLHRSRSNVARSCNTIMWYSMLAYLSLWCALSLHAL